ncbi:hypothetical protein [Xenorhabdus innexi]|uniref:Uncharacterized protein n=1 Tax=Xenorhabdus innexi TaxID=290109 RepID=A0A1N6MRL1_9GAMM|nr:hypothetical protein [Xenorhabdus innexi]PHM38468.1 hypothetical protein Xinn_00165 [Xenorhabdus innexi]SIP71460.1 membrane hypothetical protein [Xenorhabdus innexi]
MLTIPFNLFGFADSIVKEPGYVIFLSTFGMIVPLIILGILKRIPFLSVLSNITAGTIGLAFFPNFTILIILFFLNISGVHLFFVSTIIFLSCFLFIVFNYQKLADYINRLSPADNPKITDRNPRKKRRKK